ncbi:MAG TPA: NHLP bacteriocin export ABC transporter permease/ATPase subunit [Gemmatimonadaceae bacterium]|nr:NHLP bacteriocin export ABC transporter permease/ATPase subunit [Gemmatimonadaceae bacterium]
MATTSVERVARASAPRGSRGMGVGDAVQGDPGSAADEEVRALDGRRRLHRREELRRATLAAACSRLARTIDSVGGAAGATAASAPRATPLVGDVGVDTAADGPLLAACRVVGAELGIAIVRPPRFAGSTSRSDPIEAIAHASRIRSRRVVLRDAWWREDNGPLLGFRAEGGSPVVLRYAPARGYTCFDPVDASEVKVDGALADTLAPFAITFYRSFPEAALSIRDVLRFGVHGCGSELRSVVAMTVLASLLGMIPPVATGIVFDSLIPGAQRSQLLQMTVILVVCALSVAMFQVVRSVALLRIEGKMGNAVQCAVWDRLLALPMSFFRPYTAGELAARAMGIDGVRQLVSGSTVTAIVAGVTSLGNYLLLFRYSARLALWATLLISTALAVTFLGGYAQLSHQRGVAALQSRTSGVVLQLLTSISKLRVAGAEAHAFASWATRFAEQRRLQFRVRSVGNWVAAFNAGFPTAASMLVFWAALAPLTDSHSMRMGDFLAFMAAFGICLASVVTTSNAFLSMLLAIPLYEQAKPILVTPPEVDGAKEDPGELTGAIDIEHVSFRYESDGPFVLRDVTVHAMPGEFIAFVGPSGSGKSTVMRLLLGFECPEAGSIYYDGRELGGLDLRALRRQLGVVLQSGRLMTGDIYTNIVGSAPVPMEVAWEAARMAGFADDIRQMPMGMHTVISEGGGTLSGGQRQRLMIARAIVHRPRILLFDEATSALDNRTQAIVSASLEGLRATRMVIAHRLSTIMRADRIYVLRRGELVQCGSYDQLVRERGIFAELASRQLT